jgi:hypothetical protein
MAVGNTQGSTEVNPLVHVIAPIAAIAATMLARRLLNGGYRQITGHSAPVPKDPSVSFPRAIAWTALTAATAAVVEVMVYRSAMHWGEQSSGVGENR